MSTRPRRHGKFGMATRYKGRLFRSRLEARWAAFFDNLGWPYEYEPFALPGWIPDFLLLTAVPVLVEVKPYAVFPSHVADEIEQSGCVDECLIVGVSIPVRSFRGEPTVHPLCFGWMAERTPGAWWWDDAMLGQWDGEGLGFCHRHGSRVNRVTGQLGTITTPTLHRSAWIDAGNAVQWMAPKTENAR